MWYYSYAIAIRLFISYGFIPLFYMHVRFLLCHADGQLENLKSAFQYEQRLNESHLADNISVVNLILMIILAYVQF